MVPGKDEMESASLLGLTAPAGVGSRVGLDAREGGCLGSSPRRGASQHRWRISSVPIRSELRLQMFASVVLGLSLRGEGTPGGLVSRPHGAKKAFQPKQEATGHAGPAGMPASLRGGAYLDPPRPPPLVEVRNAWYLEAVAAASRITYSR